MAGIQGAGRTSSLVTTRRMEHEEDVTETSDSRESGATSGVVVEQEGGDLSRAARSAEQTGFTPDLSGYLENPDEIQHELEQKIDDLQGMLTDNEYLEGSLSDSIESFKGLLEKAGIEYSEPLELDEVVGYLGQIGDMLSSVEGGVISGTNLGVEEFANFLNNLESDVDSAMQFLDTFMSGVHVTFENLVTSSDMSFQNIGVLFLEILDMMVVLFSSIRHASQKNASVVAKARVENLVEQVKQELSYVQKSLDLSKKQAQQELVGAAFNGLSAVSSTVSAFFNAKPNEVSVHRAKFSKLKNDVGDIRDLDKVVDFDSMSSKFPDGHPMNKKLMEGKKESDAVTKAMNEEYDAKITRLEKDTSMFDESSSYDEINSYMSDVSTQEKAKFHEVQQTRNQLLKEKQDFTVTGDKIRDKLNANIANDPDGLKDMLSGRPPSFNDGNKFIHVGKDKITVFSKDQKGEWSSRSIDSNSTGADKDIFAVRGDLEAAQNNKYYQRKNGNADIDTMLDIQNSNNISSVDKAALDEQTSDIVDVAVDSHKMASKYVGNYEKWVDSYDKFQEYTTPIADHKNQEMRVQSEKMQAHLNALRSSATATGMFFNAVGIMYGADASASNSLLQVLQRIYGTIDSASSSSIQSLLALGGEVVQAVNQIIQVIMQAVMSAQQLGR